MEKPKHTKVIVGDGITDDTEALQAHLNGEKVIWPYYMKSWILKNGQKIIFKESKNPKKYTGHPIDFILYQKEE